MKLYYDKRLKDPTYYGQQGFRNGKKVTSKNVKKFGKHSELLKITDDPLAYVKEEIRKLNEEYRVGRVAFDLTADFNERVKHSDDDTFPHMGKHRLFFPPVHHEGLKAKRIL